MDYSYYKHYSLDRQKWQDNLLQSLLCAPTAVPKHPIIIFTCGTYGSGKSHVLRHLSNQGWFEDEKWLFIDPDLIKTMLPEAALFSLQNRNTASTRLHKESTFLSLLLQHIAMERELNIIVDGSLHDHGWYTEHIQYIRDVHSRYKIGILYVKTSLSVSLERCQKREKETHRHIPKSHIEMIHNRIPTSFQNLEPLVDFSVIVVNDIKPLIHSVSFH
jgi:adenylylsulfate kinase-like enzyme